MIARHLCIINSASARQNFHWAAKLFTSVVDAYHAKHKMPELEVVVDAAGGPGLHLCEVFQRRRAHRHAGVLLDVKGFLLELGANPLMNLVPIDIRDTDKAQTYSDPVRHPTTRPRSRYTVTSPHSDPLRGSSSPSSTPEIGREMRNSDDLPPDDYLLL